MISLPALNILEKFGTISGLVMNTSKTQLIWLGRNRFSKDKLKVKVKLDCDNQPFSVLSITFDRALNEITELNYEKVLADIQKLLEHWEKTKSNSYWQNNHYKDIVSLKN